jgi:CCR4-NOT transcription complex subunit 1
MKLLKQRLDRILPLLFVRYVLRIILVYQIYLYNIVLFKAIEGSESKNPNTGKTISEDFLTQFCKLLKLSVPQQVTIALAFAQSGNSENASESINFLRLKLPEISSCGSKLPSEVLHSLIYLLRTSEEFKTNIAETDSFLASISAGHPNDMGILEIAPLTLGDPDHVDCSTPPDADIVSRLANDVSTSCLFYELMQDVGYSCTSSVKAFRAVLAEAGLPESASIPPDQLAGMLVMLSRTFSGLDPENGATLMSTLPFVCDIPGASSEGAEETHLVSKESWDLDVIATVLKKDYCGIQWSKVIESLDRDEFSIQGVNQFSFLVTAYQRLSDSKFRVTSLLRTWKSSVAHIGILKAAIQCPPDIITFAESPNKLAPFEGADASSVPKNGVWFSLDVADTLLQLSERDYYIEVRHIFENTMKLCPDVLIANLAQAKSRWNSLREDMFSELFGIYVMGRPNAVLMMRHLWSVAPKLVLYASVKCFYSATSPQVVSRLFGLFRSTGDAFASAIHSNYFSFALPLAIMGANHEVLNLENWLLERLASMRTAFAMSCLAFAHRNYARAVPKNTINPQTSHVLSIESLALILKSIMGVQSALPPTIAVELRRIVNLCMETHPVIFAATRAQLDGTNAVSESRGSSETPGFTPEMIEEQANAYFQQIYTSEQNINDVVAMLKGFQSSRDERERQIFYCMIHNLFDEYRFFPRYPEMELRITGVLFGKLIEHQVLPPNFLQTALRSVLESLRESVNSKFFFFGAIALQQFVPRLRELPAYCTNLSQIPHLAQALPEIMRHVNQIVRSLEGSKPTDSPLTISSGVENDALKTQGSGSGKPVTPSKAQMSNTADEDLSRTHPPSAFARTPVTGMSPPKVTIPQQASAPSVMNVDHIFNDNSKMDENEVLAEPEDNVKDRIHFIVNNMSLSNLEAKIPEMRKLLIEQHYPWMANYLVSKRISTQPNYHGVYLIFIEKLMKPGLEKEILKRAMQSARKLLTSETITTNSQQRSLLKNLGSWIGLFTLSRNKPLLQRELDIKELLYVGYETGHLIAVTPFVAKILEGCKRSKIFKPPNPWIMGMIYAMSEIYDVPDLKLNLKFEIEVLFKSFKLNVEDQRKANILHIRATPPRVSNPDFNVKGSKTVRAPTPQARDKLSQKPAPDSGSTTPSKPIKPGIAGASPAQAGRDGAGYPSPSVGVTASESTVIPNLASYVAVNPELPLHNVNLRRLVPLAVDRAIREVISPVVERSVTIACITTREIILKDFATEVDDVKMRKAAHLMVASMSGSLALITAKEPLRNSIATHLRSLIPATAGEPQQIDHVIQVCSNENTDLGCMLIEKASSEKAMRDIDEALGAAYASRKRYQQQLQGKAIGDSVHFFEGASHQCPSNLPDPFKPKPAGVPHIQLAVYEAFQRIPRPASMPLSRAGYPASGNIRDDKDGAGIGSLPTDTGITPSAALDRFAALMEKFEIFVQNVVRQAAATQRDLPSLLVMAPESDIFGTLREVRSLGTMVKPAARDEACLKIGSRIVKCMYELGSGGRGDELFLEILCSSLEALAQSSEKLRKEISSWVLRASVEDKLKLHCEIIVALIRFKVVDPTEFDMYLTRNMERSSVAIEFAVHVVRQCLQMEHVTLLKQLPSTLDALARIVERHGGSGANKNVQILSNLLEQARNQKNFARPKAASSSKAPGNSGNVIHEQAAFRHTVSNALEHWIAIFKEPTGNTKIHAQYIQMLKQYGLLNDDESIALFFKFSTELCVDACLKNTHASNPNGLKNGTKAPLNYSVVDALTHLMSLLVKYLDPNANAKLQVLNHAVGAIANVLVAAHDASRKKKVPFDQRVFFRMFVNLMKDLTAQEPVLEAIHLQILNTFASAFNTLQPLVLPGFVFAWTELISHRCFMPLLLRAKQQRGWQILHRLIMNLLIFLEPFIRHTNVHPMTESISTLYKGTIRIILVLLHDYPDFLSDFYTSFCDVLPASCIQLRNVILSAFSRAMRVPDPLTLGLQVSQLPEVGIAPRLMPAWGAALSHNGIKEYIDEFLRATSNRAAVFPHDLISKLLKSQAQIERDPASCKYSIPAMNALVLYLGKEAISEMANTAPSSRDDKHGTTATFEQSASMDVFRFLADELDSEGRYWYLSSLANHLRYPNSHTHYFSCVILYLFSYSSNKMVKEQITRVLMERLIANRPHPVSFFLSIVRSKKFS